MIRPAAIALVLATIAAALASAACLGPAPQCDDGFDTVAAGFCVRATPLALAESRAYAKLVTFDGGALAVGGYDGGPQLFSAAVERFDLAAASFSPGPTLPGPRITSDAIDLGARGALVFGGRDDAQTALRAPVLLEPGALDWRTLPELPAGHAAGTATHLGDRVLFIGGIDGPIPAADASAAVSVLDLATMTATAATPLPGPRLSHAAIAPADGSVLVVGGDDDGTLGAYEDNLGDAVLLEADGVTWTLLPGMAVPRYHPALAPLLDGRILVIGGAPESVPGPATEICDPVTRTFEAGPEIERRGPGVSAISVGDHVIVLGGDRDDERYLVTVIHLSTLQVTELPAADGLRARYGGTAAVAVAPGTFLLEGLSDDEISVFALYEVVFPTGLL